MDFRLGLPHEYRQIAGDLMDAAYKIYETLNDPIISREMEVNDYWGIQIWRLIENELEKAESEWDLD